MSFRRVKPETPSMLQLRHGTPAEWVRVVESDIIGFLQDHAANERKVAVAALKLAARNLCS